MTVVVVLSRDVAVGSPPEARVTQRAVTAWQAGAAPGAPLTRWEEDDAGWVASEPLPADDAALVGAEWDGFDEGVEVQLRSQGGDGWTPWAELHTGHDDLPDPDSAEGQEIRHEVSEPIWVGDADRLQVRVRGTDAPAVTLHVVEMTGSTGLDYVPARASSTEILPRSAWDPSGQCERRAPPSYAEDVRFAVVHHTAGSNSYSASQAAAQVLAVCLFHTQSQGFHDIGYNFLVDRYGRAYEGRSGGMSEAVIGGHALGFNAGSTGIAYLGTFTEVEPPSAARQAMRDVVAWKLDQHHVDPLGVTTEVATASTGPFSAGDVVTLPTVIGHRDVRATVCPGDGGYAYIEGAQLASDAAGTGGLKIYGGPPGRLDQPVLGVRPEITVAFSRSTPWYLEVRDGDGRAVRGALAEGAAANLRWDLRDEDGEEVAPGRYVLRLSAGSATPLVTELNVRPSTEEITGGGAEQRSAAASARFFGEPRRAEAGWPELDHVVIASASSRGDALVAATIAASHRAPILLTDPAALHASVVAEINRLGATSATVVGDTSEVTGQVVDALVAQTTVTSVDRRGGETRYHTAGRVGWRVVERHEPREAVLVLGEGPDPVRVTREAAVGAAFAAAQRLPVLFVRPDQLTEPTRWVLEEHAWDRVTVIGGHGIMSEQVRAAAAEAAGNVPVMTIAATTADETAALVAKEVTDRAPWATADPNVRDVGSAIVIAASALDAVVGGALAAQRDAALLLADGPSLDVSPHARAWITSRADELVHSMVIGVAPGVAEDVDAGIRAAGPHLAPPEAWPGGLLRFSDIAFSPHRGAIERIAEAEITSGCDSGGTRYCPRDPVSRGQMATFLANAMGLEPIAEERFADVPLSHAHNGTINAVAESGVASGFPDGTYGPGHSVTRAQMATFLANALGLEAVAGARFPDVPASHAHAGTINAMSDEGLAQGFADGTFGPEIPVTRAQMATFLANALDRGLGEG